VCTTNENKKTFKTQIIMETREIIFNKDEKAELYEKIFIAENCPNCGDALIVTTDCAEADDNDFEQFFRDGDDVKCAADCGFISCVSVDENRAGIHDGNIDDLSAHSGGDIKNMANLNK